MKHNSRSVLLTQACWAPSGTKGEHQVSEMYVVDGEEVFHGIGDVEGSAATRAGMEQVWCSILL